MLKLIVLVVSLIGLFSVCVGQVIQEGQCDPNVGLQPGFEIDRFLGTWHEYYRLENPNQQGDCSAFTLSDTDNGLEVYYSAVNNNFLEESEGTVSQDGNSAKLRLSIPMFDKPIDFWVLQTFYDSNAITFSCEDISAEQSRLYIWVLRRPGVTFNPITLAFIRTTILNTFGIELETLRFIDHNETTCDVLPVIEPGNPIIFPGQCDPDLHVVQGFEIDRFLGVWHQISNYETSNAEGACIRAEYTKGDGVVNVLNSQVVDKKIETIDGHASVSSTDGSAKLSVVLNIPGGSPVTQELWILRSDYDNYAVAYTCVNDEVNDQRRVYSWILSRERQLSPSVQTAVDEAIRSYLDLNSVYYFETNQTDAGCFFYPEPTDEPVVFRGQCESVNVQAMPNFEAEKYMGLWHNIGMYPSRFQDGTCSNAIFELIDGNVTVINSQVKDQRLETITAVTVPASDGSAKLIVTFPGETVPTDYWILDTDYVNFAFVYTCQNLNADEIQVGSWKLSRTKQLLPASELAINEVISKVLYLDDQYYINVNQTEGGCFYFPEPQKSVPVVFPGQCDENVGVVQNFNFADFDGTWFDIESYPKAERTGQCVDHQFTFINNTRLDLVSYSVTDQFRGDLSGFVTRSSSTDNTGKLTITITDAHGEVKTIPFWVLAVSYNDFAFAYACENINADFRAVWSWKLSRTRELSSVAKTAISNAMTDNIVLEDYYFEKIDHSNDACFYLPELKPGEPVILHGQCDPNIRGIDNFNIEKYAGRWRLIESYESDFQNGTCNVGRYTQQGSNVLGVTNSQVIDGRLDSIFGTATLSSSDGSGQLTFNFPGGGGNFDVLILDTDYDSYALGYGCVDLPDNQMRVYSWKMSRENTLSTDAISQINGTIDSIRVLNNRFYYFINRTDTGCFYLPTVDPSSIVKFRGHCDQNIPVVTNFQLERYLGTWYDIESYPEKFQNGKCNTATYIEHSLSGVDMIVYNTQVINQGLATIIGTAVQEQSIEGKAKFTLSFNVGGTEVTANYWVLRTDYDNYALVYSCRPVDDEYVQVTSWKLSRSRELTPFAQAEIEKAMSEIRTLDNRYFIGRNHTPEGCFYFPDPQPGMPVVFPGQCDESVAAEPNFNINEFQGTWHEIAAYPEAGQVGQCISQQFTVTGTTSMRLDSFSVLDLTQSTTESQVTFASDDLSGKLNISSLVKGKAISRPYWILSTDYNQFALVYSCVNIDKDYRGVWSWKLSRSRQLSDSANAAIDDAISKVDVLRNDYYEKVQQTDAACFHLPNITPGDNVVLPGRCDLNIGGMPNFNITKYVGEWRLIESYGSKYQGGTCNVAQYTLQAGNILSVTNSQVVDGQLASVSGTATISSSDGRGQLTFNINGEEFEVYILDTDYDSYALAYGCENLENDQRKVSSWKLSRSNTLSQDATNIINDIINGIEVLHQPYYYSVDRTPYSCFYFPEPDRNTPVRFRGQCDESISAVPDFKLEEYMGLWHDIESYPVAFQDGECPNAKYSLLSSNTASVSNTQVVDQSLDVIQGLASVASTDGSAKLKVTFDGLSSNGASDYWVLATDYESYSFVYSCANLNDDYMSVASWKLSRRKELTPYAKAEIDKAMSEIRALDKRYFIERDHTPEGCFYFPEPQPGVPVVFPGQCDDSIAAEPNFNINEFQGTWHEIAAYPEAGQDGQCISQQFTVTGTTSMRLDSFSVLDLTQSTTERQVTFASDDLSGKLNISSLVNEEAISRPYWILSTDYTNYALVYSCVNINQDYREVWSWKLSRSRQLSDSANAAIDDAISKVDVLRNDYYENVQQTDAACFHLPDITPGDNVVLPGRCDLNIGGMPDFNITKYVGEWRLIESYGSKYQGGTCNVAQYTLQAGNILSVTNSQVVDGQLASVSGTATISSSDGRGQLTFNINGEEFDVYILDTDYDSYALAYGCENLENDQRKVSSWKLSRSNTLSQDATNIINDIINGIEVLHQPYYYSVDRTPYSCFYFPEPDRNTPVRFRGQCDESISAVPDFKLEEYMGLWHDIESYPVAFQDGECPNAKYSLLSSNTASVSNTQVVDQSLDVIQGLASVASTDGSAKLKVTFDGQSSNGASDYWVLATDYESYSFVYSCANLNDDYMSVASWKLSRRKELTPYAKAEIDKAMSEIRALDKRYFIERDHTPEGCFYFPEPQPGVPVVFPGQCDDSIAAEPNFNINEFQGTWHEIAAYPEAGQDGQCISQQFTVTGTTSMRLDSFSVLDLTQSTTERQVTFASDDLSGKLNISSLVNEEAISRPYWILSTDYTNYALVYSCVNINQDYREVWSWKLSRSRQLSDSANAAIDDAISKVDVLRNDYYENVQQTDAACFFYPDLGPSDPVIFPGQCDPNIPVVVHFNATRFIGRWRVMESYHSDFQEGTCNAATYSLADDDLMIIDNSQVINEQLDSITGSAVPASSDGSGKLVVNFPNRGPIEYWILDTDYDSYALIYTCVNLSNEERRVWSWKMSRLSSLSASATDAINQIVDSVNVLKARYYQPIDRTDVGCFYYPVPDANSNVIFPGQCDENIPVVQSFNAALYVGPWHDVESYPSNFQNGTCNTAVYTLNTDGTLTVKNTQVVDQLLQTVTATAVPSTTDGSAKFDVTLANSTGIDVAKYWILDTDYVSYSLVYSCRNIDDEFREVYSWKLGRKTTLPEDAEASINDIIDNVQVLGQDYFVERSHSNEDCFYYPDFNGGDVILSGQCIPGAEVVVDPNFNANAFAGLWYEVSRFPSTLQNGECTATEYSLNGANIFNVTQTSVIKEEKLSTITQAGVANGVISIMVNGVPFNDVYILATDHTEYALAYSCRNLDADRKQLYSWKLSRRRAGLSEAANYIIDELVSKNIDLHEPYYRSTRQDHAACFYYPVFDQVPFSIELPGPCPAITGLPNLNVNNYLGTWYEVARYPNEAQTGQCNRAVYETGATSDAISVVNIQVVDEASVTISGQAVVTSDDGQIEVTYIVDDEIRTAKYYVLHTDYNNYALLYSCVTIDSGNRRRVGSWKLSRTTELSSQANIAINIIIENTQGLLDDYYQDTSHTHAACFYYPVFDQLPSYIQLPGPCNTSITGVPDFDINRYLGTWYEIARYPQPAQTGQCTLAEFEDGATSGTYSVMISQIHNVALSKIRGEATVTSVDGSGKLEVRLSVNSVISYFNYYVLATDYTRYALVYTCHDSDDGRTRRVGSWKISRSTDLSETAETVINEVVSTTQGLNNNYYQTTSHTHADCFHYPTQTGDRVILPGQCDTTIPAVESFNVARFANNSWYQIERYDAVGDSSCIGTKLSFDGETRNITVISFEVANEDLVTTEGTGRLSSDDGSGKFSLVMDADSEGGEPTTTTIYILATDYDGYALAYSCRDININQREVGAWQLSRERTMTEAGKTAIAELIERRQELYKPYFKPISHEGECPEPSSAFSIKSSIIVIFVCVLLQIVW